MLVVCQHSKTVLRRCLTSAAPEVCQLLAQCWSAALALLTGYNRNGTAPVVRIGSTPIFSPGVMALIRSVYGPNKVSLLLTEEAWSIPYLRYPYGSDRIRIRSTLLVIRILCLMLPFFWFLLLFDSVITFPNLPRFVKITRFFWLLF